MKIIHYNKPINWADPKEDYRRIVQLRQANLVELTKYPGAVPNLIKYYFDGRWPQFISDWGWTFDPRELDPSFMYRPFILYKRQIEYTQWVYERWQKRQRGLCKKFRGAGASWLDAALAVMMWLGQPNSIVTLGSQKAEKVDAGDGDPDSLLWKVRKYIDLLPSLFVPDDWRKQSKMMLVVNPRNGSAIRGEIGDQIGRGGRATMVYADEFAELEHPQRVESALAETADCVIMPSTIPETGYIGSKFHELEHHLPEEQIFIWQWHEDERKRLRPELEPEQEEWYIKKKRELSPAVFEAQFLLTNTAATTNSFIPGGLIVNANQRSKVSIPDRRGPWQIGIDASGMGADKTIIWRRRGYNNLPPMVFEKLDGIQLAMKVKEVVAQCLETGPVGLIAIERDGPGGSCADQLKYTPIAPVVAAIHTGTRLKDGNNYNLRAWLHRQAREYLEEGVAYIPPDPVFEAQATAIQYEYKGGALLIESKEEYRARFSGGTSRLDKRVGKSPDRWDAFVLTFVPPVGPPLKSMIQVGETRVGESRWKPLDPVMGY